MTQDYQPPRIERLGTLRELTQQGAETNSDVPQGVANSAWPVNGGPAS